MKGIRPAYLRLLYSLIELWTHQIFQHHLTLSVVGSAVQPCIQRMVEKRVAHVKLREAQGTIISFSCINATVSIFEFVLYWIQSQVYIFFWHVYLLSFVRIRSISVTCLSNSVVCALGFYEYAALVDGPATLGDEGDGTSRYMLLLASCASCLIHRYRISGSDCFPSL